MVALRKWAPWAVLVTVAAVVLAFGLHRSSSPSLDARVQSVAAQVRCPVCNGETVAQSQAAPSVEIRTQIRQELVAGESQGQILAGLVSSYGPGILEKPQASGIGLVVWVVPVVAVVLGAGGLVIVIRRWRERAGPGAGGPAVASSAETSPGPDPAVLAAPPSGAPPSGAPPSGASGGVSAGALAVAAPTDVAAPPEVPSVSPGPSTRRPKWSPRTRWAVTGAGIALVAAGASWAVVASSGTRLPGQAITGQVLPAEAVAADIQAATTAAQNNDVVGALKDYEKVLKADPNQVEALSGMGWLLAQTGQPNLLKQGLAQLAAAEKADPTYAPAHLYRGFTLLGEGDYTDSIPELQWYLDHNPDAQLVNQVKKALTDARAGAAAARPATGGPGAPTSATTVPLPASGG